VNYGNELSQKGPAMSRLKATIELKRRRRWRISPNWICRVTWCKHTQSTQTWTHFFFYFFSA